MRVPVLGVVHDVVVEDLPEGTEGEHRPNQAQIAVSAAVTPGRRWPVLRHEAGHAVMHEGGMRVALRALLRAYCGHLTPEQLEIFAEDVEECVVDGYTALLCHTLEQMGWLTPPQEVK